MINFKSRKNIIIIVVTVVVLIGIGIGVYLLIPKQAAPAQQQVTLEQTPNYSACTIISIDDIKATEYANLVTNVQAGVREGSNAPNGTIADGCEFTLTTAKSSDNSLTVKAYDYTATVDGQDKESVDDSWSEVGSSNPKAYFGRAIENGTTVYKLRVIPGGKNVLFELRQPTEAIAIDEPSALDFLVGLAVKADFSVLETETDPQS
ncbi:MAG: hypothetical protein WAQ27_02960 [Candidatus Microsaccharimonas sp.]